MYPKPTDKSDMVIFIDGSLSSFENTDLVDDGEFREFHLQPIKWTRYNYQIEDKEYDEHTNIIKKKYKADLCINLRATPSNQVWLIWQTYDGKERPDLIKKFDSGLLEQNRALVKENRMWRALLYRTQISQEKGALFKRQEDILMVEKIERMRKAFGKPKEDEDADKSGEQ